MTLHVGGVGFQLVRDVPEAVGKMRLDYGDTPELGCGHAIERCRLPQGLQKIGVGYHSGNVAQHREGGHQHMLVSDLIFYWRLG
jgi:hypothetical protein